MNYKVGDKVYHKGFGCGVIEHVANHKDNTRVDVRFKRRYGGLVRYIYTDDNELAKAHHLELIELVDDIGKEEK